MIKKDIKNSNFDGPDFLCIGMQKAATRWLYDQLRFHDDIWMPPVKEFHFYNKGFNFERAYKLCGKFLKRQSFKDKDGQLNALFFYQALFSDESSEQYRKYKKYKSIRKIHNLKKKNNQRLLSPPQPYNPDKMSFQWYRSLFEFSGNRVCGDITPAYCFLNRDLIRRIGIEFTNVKIILLLRNPVERAWSQFRMAVRRNRIDETILSSSEQILDTLKNNYNFYYRSFPSVTYRNWSSEINPMNIKFFFFDNICKNPKEVITNICKFLKIDSSPSSISKDAKYDKKARQKKIKMPVDIRKSLRMFFSEEIIKCQELFGGPAMNW